MASTGARREGRPLFAFPKVQSLQGELKRSEVRAGVRYQLTTHEFVLQREQRTYRIALDNVLGLVACSDEEYRVHAGRVFGRGTHGRPYKIVATLMYLISPAGVIEQSRVSFYARLSPPFASQLEKLLSRSS